jgi:hypothetical protein
MTWSKETVSKGPMLVGWNDGSWAVGELVAGRWVEQGNDLAFSPQPTLFAEVEPPPSEAAPGADSPPAP